MKSFLHLASVDDVIKVLTAAQSLSAETIPLEKANGRYLANDFHAPCDLPGFARSKVDGYAAMAEDLFGASESSPALLELVGQIHMGQATNLQLQRGQIAAIPTGGMLPKGANCAAMLEYSRDAGQNLVEITRAAAPGANIVLANEDAAEGDLLLPSGTLLNAPQIGCLAAFGVNMPEVFRQPNVTVIATGDELVPINCAPAKAQLRNVNSWSIEAICQSNGAVVERSPIVPDNQNLLAEAVNKALAHSDIALVTGGSSAGQRDFTLDAFLAQKDAELICHGVAISPGKPFIAVRCGSKYLLGLPGHVASAIISGYVFVAPLLRALQGNTAPRPLLPVRLTRSVAAAQGRRDYIRCTLERQPECQGGQWLATPLTGASAVLSGLVRANGLVICPENREGLAKGDTALAIII